MTGDNATPAGIVSRSVSLRVGYGAMGYLSMCVPIYVCAYVIGGHLRYA